MVPSVDPSSDPSSVTAYVPSVNLSIAPSEEQFRAIQEERWATLEQVKALENIIESGEIKVDESAQLQYLVVFAC